MTYARLTCAVAASSSMVAHGRNFGLPQSAVPRMILDTLRPEFPRRTANKIDIESERTVVHKEEMAEARTVLHLVHDGRHRSRMSSMRSRLAV